MNSKKQKYYVVWEGNNSGIFNAWDDCKIQIKNYKGAKYKSFKTLKEAEKAYSMSYYEYKNIKPKKIDVEPPNYNSISVDAASSGNPGKMEYQGVDTKSKRILFIQGPYKEATNNIGEFLALVHGLAAILALIAKEEFFNIFTREWRIDLFNMKFILLNSLNSKQRT